MYLSGVPALQVSHFLLVKREHAVYIDVRNYWFAFFVFVMHLDFSIQDELEKKEKELLNKDCLSVHTASVHAN